MLKRTGRIMLIISTNINQYHTFHMAYRLCSQYRYYFSYYYYYFSDYYFYYYYYYYYHYYHS